MIINVLHECMDDKVRDFYEQDHCSGKHLGRYTAHILRPRTSEREDTVANEDFKSFNEKAHPESS